MEDIMQKMDVCGRQLDVWNQNEFGIVQRQLCRAKNRFQNIIEEDPTCSNRDRFYSAKSEVNIWLNKEEIMWRQSSKALWLKDGDKNTRFFHMKTSHIYKKNMNIRLKDDMDV